MNIENVMMDFWRGEVARLRNIATIEGSVDEMVALKFLLAAEHRVRRLKEADGHKTLGFPFNLAVRRGILKDFCIIE